MTADLRRADFTSRSVYLGTARLLEEVIRGSATDTVVVDRYSVADGSGIHRQIQATKMMFGAHADTATYAAIDPSLFDSTANRRLAFERSMQELGHSGRIVRRRDLWPTETSGEVIGAIVHVGRTLFLRIESSGSKRNIANIAGTDLNAYSQLVWSVTTHLDGPALTRWSDDVHRAGRDALAMKKLVDAHQERRKGMQFGLSKFDPQDPNQRMLLTLMCEMGEQDNEARAIKMFGAKASQFFSGRVAIAESRLPHGVFHKREERQTLRGTEYVKASDVNGRVPIWDPLYEKPIAAAVQRHADGASYADIGEVLAEFNVERRSTGELDHPTFRDLSAAADLSRQEKRARLSESAKTFLTPSSSRKGNWVSDPNHPDFDPEMTALLHSKLLLWETGYWHTRLGLGAVRGIGRTVKGHALRYDGEAVSGWIMIPAPLFVNEHGASAISIGLEPEVWMASRERLSAEKMKRSHTGGTAHERQHGRILHFNTWYDGDFDPLDPPCGPSGEVVDHGIRHFRIGTRSQGQGSQLNRVLRVRPAAKSVKSRQGGGQRGWGSAEGEILATFNDAELCHALANVAETEVSAVIDHLQPVALLPDEGVICSNNGMSRRIEDLNAAIDELKRDHRALRLEVARRGVAVDDLSTASPADERRQLEEALELARSDEAHVHREIIERERELDALETEGDTSRSCGGKAQPDVELQAATNVGEIAWWIAGLRRTVDGTGDAALRETTARVLREWRVVVSADGAQVRWSCDLVWPELSGGVLRLPLAGTVPNRRLHRRPGGKAK